MSRYSIIARPSPAVTYGLALALIFGISLFLRTYFPYDNVFPGDWVRFQINDPWFHMRLVENLVQHFPHLISFDPYAFYPHGLIPNAAPFFDWLLGFFVWIIGLGSPSRQLIETLGAYFPAILGALITVPVFFIGKALFNRNVGLLAAALIAILPGQFLLRTLLGFSDHHVAEILFSTTTMLFLMLAVKSSKQKGLSFDMLRARQWGDIKKPLIYSILTGVSLGFYLLSWVGGGLLVFIIFVYVIFQHILDHWKGRSTGYLSIVGVPVFLVALLMVAPISGRYAMGGLQVASLVIGMLALVALSGLSNWMTRRKTKRTYYPLALIVLGGIGLLGLYLVNPGLLESIFDKLNVLRPAGGALTISEAKPLFSGGIEAVWGLFTTGFFLALVSLALIAYLVIKEDVPDRSLLLVWSVLMLIAALGQNRFSYYYAVNVAILTAFLSWKILELAGFREALEATGDEIVDSRSEPEKVIEKARLSKKAKRKLKKSQLRERHTALPGYPAKYARGILALVVVFFLAFYPNIGGAIDNGLYQRGATDDWRDSLVWMRENTPDPFLNPDFFYELYETPAPEESYKFYPPSSYGVMSWWDYGYWITYIAHRIPNAIPGQAGAEEAARFFTAQTESEANEVLDRAGSRYVIIDDLTALSKFYAIATYAGRTAEDFFETYYQRNQAGQLNPVRLFYPEYYRAVSSRLYNFGGRSWDPYEDWIKGTFDDQSQEYKEKIQVITYSEKSDASGIKYKEITRVEEFTNYETAKAFVDTNPGYAIVGTSPLLSPVPLDELEHYKLVYRSPTIAAERLEEPVSQVQVFEYVP